VLYAAAARGRHLEANGAALLFDEAKRLIRDASLNPLIDSVLEASDEFRPELALLDREAAAYERDIARSRRAVVSVPRAPGPFTSWFHPLESSELLTDTLEIRSEHCTLAHSRDQVDGIYVRDPECLLFKDWARRDLDNSPAGKGFMFTAIAYSAGVPGAERNSTRYYFSLDPELADGRHLYPVWARIQQAETSAIAGGDAARPLRERLLEADRIARLTGKRTCREQYCGRAGQFGPFFDDPWFGGDNYAATIVDTPNRGTMIDGAGVLSDLTDDQVVRLVERELEWSWVTSELVATDFPAVARSTAPVTTEVDLTDGTKDLPACRDGHFRFAAIHLADGVDLQHVQLAEQIAVVLSSLLATVPHSCSERDPGAPTLVAHDDWLATWNQRGIVMAFKASAERTASAFKELMSEMAGLARGLEQLVHGTTARPSELERRAVEAEALVRRAARLKHRLTFAENQVPRQFFDALRLDQLLASIREINLVAMRRLEEKQTVSNIRIVAKAQSAIEHVEVFIISVYAAHLWHMMTAENEPLRHGVDAVFGAGAFEWIEPISVAFWAAVGFFVARAIIRRVQRRLDREIAPSGDPA
jgi:hypothetical protein